MEKISQFMKGKKTYTGIAMLLIPTIASWFDVQITEAESSHIVTLLMELAGTILAVYGYNAKEKN